MTPAAVVCVSTHVTGSAGARWHVAREAAAHQDQSEGVQRDGRNVEEESDQHHDRCNRTGWPRIDPDADVVHAEPASHVVVVYRAACCH